MLDLGNPTGAFSWRALAIWEKALGPEHPDLAQRLVQLARGLEELDLRDEAEPLERRARAIEEKARAER